MNQSIFNKVIGFSSYNDIYEFMDYLILENNQEKIDLIKDLKFISNELPPDSIAYIIVTDVIDYLVGFHGKFESSSKEKNFIDVMKKR